MKKKLTNWMAGITAALALTLSTGSVAAQCVKGANSFPLIAGQNINVGNVSLQVDGTDLVVTYTTTDPWQLGFQHLWVGDNLAGLPVNKSGNPTPGKFPYKGSGPFRIPLADLGFACPGADKTFYVAAHAEVWLDNGDGTMTGETAWSDGGPIVPGNGNWGMFSEFELTCNCAGLPDDGEQRCETAFAKTDSSVCFLDLGINRWGWTTALSDESYSMELWAAAGQCDTSKGALVGTVTVTYSGSAVTVNIQAATGLTLRETHIYVGYTPVPIDDKGKPTVAPGQYTVVKDNLNAATDTQEFTVSGPIYLIVHAVVCGNY